MIRTMIAVVQRVTAASVTVGGEIVGKIDAGLCVLASIVKEDTEADLRWVAAKVVALRVFPNGDKAYDRSVADIGGRLLLVSNFTVAANTSSGRRPGFDAAMSPSLAKPMFDRFVELVRETGVTVATGEFGAEMSVAIANDGPLTLIVDSKRR